MQAHLPASVRDDADHLTTQATCQDHRSTLMSNNSKPAEAGQIRDLSVFELDAVAGGAATKTKPPFPGPCFPRPPKPESPIM